MIGKSVGWIVGQCVGIGDVCSWERLATNTELLGYDLERKTTTKDAAANGCADNGVLQLLLVRNVVLRTRGPLFAGLCHTRISYHCLPHADACHRHIVFHSPSSLPPNAFRISD